MAKLKPLKPPKCVVPYDKGIDAIKAITEALNIPFHKGTETLWLLTGFSMKNAKWDNNREGWITTVDVAHKIDAILGPHAYTMIKILEARENDVPQDARPIT